MSALISDQVKNARNILRTFSEDYENLKSDCAEEGFDEAQCTVVGEVLKQGREGLITRVEEQELRDAGFSQVFVRELAGAGGAKALGPAQK